MNPNRLPSTVAFILLAVILGKTTAQLCYCVNYDDIIYYYNDGINNAGCPTDCTANCDVVDDMFVVNKPACVSCCTCCCTDNTSPYYHTNDNFDLNNGCAPIPTTTTTTTTATTPTTTPGANGGD